MSYQSTILADNPLRLWMMESQSGGVIPDAAGNGTGMTINGGVTIGSPSVITSDSVAGQFDGTTGYTDEPCDGILFDPAGFTIELWLNQPREAGTAFSVGDQSSGSPKFQINFGAGAPALHNSEAGTSVGSSNYLTDGDHFIAITVVGGGNAEIYIDGVLDTTGAIGSLTLPTTGYEAAIGARVAWFSTNTVDSYSAGAFQAVAVWNSILTATQIQNHYNAGTATGGSTTPIASGSIAFTRGVSATATYTSPTLNLSATMGRILGLLVTPTYTAPANQPIQVSTSTGRSYQLAATPTYTAPGTPLSASTSTGRSISLSATFYYSLPVALQTPLSRVVKVEVDNRTIVVAPTN